MIDFFKFLTLHSAFRYLIVGGGLFVLDLLVFLGMTTFIGSGPALAQMAARATGAGIGFLGHRYYSFRQPDGQATGSVAKQGGGYFLVSIATFLLSPIIVVGMLRFCDGRAVLAKVLAEIVLVILTYSALKFVFHKKWGWT